MTPTPPQAGERAEASRYGLIQVGVMYGEHIVREMEECEEGEWVDYDDYAAITVRMERAETNARIYSAALARAIPHLPTQSLRDEFAAALDSEESK